MGNYMVGSKWLAKSVVIAIINPGLSMAFDVATRPGLLTLSNSLILRMVVRYYRQFSVHVIQVQITVAAHH